MTKAPLANRFADYAGRLRFDALPAGVVREAKRRFIDSIATAVGAMSAEAYAVARRCALRVQGQPGAGLFGGGRSSVEWATFVNGLLIRYLDYNDTYLSLEPAHPSDNLAPVLAVGDMRRRRRQRPDHRRRAGLRDPVPALRRLQPAQARLRPRHLRRHLVVPGGLQIDGPGRRKDDARGRHRRRLQRRPAADAGRRTEHVEGLRLRQRRPQRRLRRPARRRGDDRPGPDLRGRTRLHEAGHAEAIRAAAAGRRAATRPS